jgi:hypothetical protein
MRLADARISPGSTTALWTGSIMRGRPDPLLLFIGYGGMGSLGT